MDFGWVTPPLCIAVVALYVAWSNYRRNNFTIIRVRECGWSYPRSAEENGCQPFYHFRIVLQNIGIPLHNLHLTLSFADKSGSGRISMPLKGAKGEVVRSGQFAKGMITDFSLKSYEFDELDFKFLSRLEDMRKQGATFCLYADGFLAWEYRLGGLTVPAKRLWNRLAGRVNSLLTRRMGTNREGMPIVKEYALLPRFVIPSQQLLQFAHYLQQEQAAA